MSNVLRVMLVDDSRGRAAILDQALSDAGYQVIGRCDANDDLIQRVRQSQPDIILIDMESPNRDTLENLRSINQDLPRPIVMFAERSDAQTTESAIRAGVSAYVVDGLNPARLQPILQVAITRFREFQALRGELEDARNRLADRKVIEKAKGLLMQRKNIGEDEAYRALRKMAMDRNQRLAEVARNVISLMALLD